MTFAPKFEDKALVPNIIHCRERLRPGFSGGPVFQIIKHKGEARTVLRGIVTGNDMDVAVCQAADRNESVCAMQKVSYLVRDQGIIAGLSGVCSLLLGNSQFGNEVAR